MQTQMEIDLAKGPMSQERIEAIFRKFPWLRKYAQPIDCWTFLIIIPDIDDFRNQYIDLENHRIVLLDDMGEICTEVGDPSSERGKLINREETIEGAIDRIAKIRGKDDVAYVLWKMNFETITTSHITRTSHSVILYRPGRGNNIKKFSEWFELNIESEYKAIQLALKYQDIDVKRCI